MAKKYKCRVEYLESSGTQYIDTGYIASDTSGFSVRIMPLQATDKYFIGSRPRTVTNDRWLAGSNAGPQVYIGWNTNNFVNWELNKVHTVQNNFMNNRTKVLDGTVVAQISETLSSQGTRTVYLFSANDATAVSMDTCRVYKVQISEGSSLVRDFIPVLDLSGKPAMYDQVSGRLFYNQGTGEFTYGRQIIPVEWLESTGTQYIDTGFKGKNNLHYKAKVNFTTLSTGGSNGIGGEYLANASAYIGMVRANGHYTYLFNNTAVETTTTIYANTDYEIDSVMDSGNQVLKVNGETISTGTISGTFTSTRNIFLYAICSTNEAADVYGSLKMYYCQIYDNDVLVRDFIPCIDENNTPFMFDNVNCTVYLNAGAGQFKVGPNVEKVWGGKKLRRKLALALANLKKKRKYYCEVEWIKTDAINSYFNTGISGDNNNLKFDIYFSTTTTDLYAPIFGNADQEAQNNWGIIKGNNNSLGYANTRRNSGLNFTEYKTDGTLNHIIFYRQGNSCIMNVNGTTTNQNVVDGTSNNANIYIGRAGPTRSPTSSRECKHYRFMIYDNDVLVRDFIPVLGWDGKGYMYDRVSGQLFGNAGTGDFVVGRQIHPVEYLESTGTQYIDTGIVGTNENMGIDVTWAFSNNDANMCIFSSRSAQTSNSFTLFWLKTASNRIRFDTTGQPYFANGVNASVSDDIFNFNYKSAEGAIATLTNKTTEQIQTLNTGKLTTFSTNNLYLFASRDTGTVGSWIKMYNCQIYDSNTLVRDYVPMVDEQGVGAMFDRVSHTIYDNAGTGAFAYPAREVEYLESDGARAIVAGVTVDDTSGYDVKWMALNANDTIILGTKGSGDSRWVLSGSNNPNVNISWNTSSGGTGLGLNKIQTAQMNYFNDRKRILNDTPLTDITQTLSANASTYSVGIFGGYWGASQISLYSTCRIYYAKISKGTGLVRDFVPMFKDGSPCLFDKIGGLYYFGTGTGSFTTGKILEPEYE